MVPMQDLQTYLQVLSQSLHQQQGSRSRQTIIGYRVFHIKQRQLPMTAAYAFTDYKSQGQTIEYVIVDIGDPPTGHMSPFGVYVALSRSRGRGTIRLLRDFNEKLFTHHPSEDLRLEMTRLEKSKESLIRSQVVINNWFI